ncbi:MAG: YmdB family metallophosphoesterase [Candidatus Doudnabacteria bacterium]|nr:YmdB family metallophosphoesterase [Candidatus Doudnabacteria bacterium]
MSKILFIGDIVGKPGRKSLAQVLPMWKEKYKPDAVIVNTENAAHGKGVTLSTLSEIDVLGVDCFTGGNHSFDKEDQVKVCFEKYPKLIRPVNLPGTFEGYGFYRFSKPVVVPFMEPDKSGNYKTVDQQFLVINLHGTVFCEKFFDGQLSNPFLEVDRILKQEAQKGDIILVDFHAEATSEKKTLGHYLDGRVSAVVGTHTHVPTADAHIMPKGSAYITDVGMVGTRDSALGTKFENALAKFLDPELKFKNEVEESGVIQVNGVLIEIGENQKAVRVEKLYEEISNIK